MQYRHPPIQEHVVYSHLDFIYVLKIYIEFRSFGGICSGGILTLQKKQGLVAPATQAFGRYGFLWFLMSFYRFWTVFYGLWRSCFIKNLVLLTKTLFFSQKLAQNQVLIPRPVFFRDLVDVGYKYKYKYIICKFYIEFSCFGGKCCGGILTLQKIKVWWPRHNR